MKHIFSIWHSVKPWKKFLEELESVDFDFLVDVRSVPFSRYNPQFNRYSMQKELWSKYIFKWNLLWWFDNISQDDFEEWIDFLSILAENKKVVFMCSEKDYNKCHRSYKIAPALLCKGFFVIHFSFLYKSSIVVLSISLSLRLRYFSFNIFTSKFDSCSIDLIFNNSLK